MMSTRKCRFELGLPHPPPPEHHQQGPPHGLRPARVRRRHRCAAERQAAAQRQAATEAFIEEAEAEEA